VLEYAVEDCNGVYAFFNLHTYLRGVMTTTERDAIVNDGRWHHTSRACAGVRYRLWYATKPTRLAFPLTEQLALF
jgi:hypothetical protein